MNGLQLARALGSIINERPDLERAFEDCLAKWVKSVLMKGPALEALRKFRSAGGDDFIAWHLNKQEQKSLLALAKKLDPHLPNAKSLGATALRLHLSALVGGRIEPTVKARKPKVDEILRLSSSHQRRAELERLSPAQLKAAIKSHDINIGGLGSRPSKTELIEHIQAAIASGWPETRSVLDDSRY